MNPLSLLLLSYLLLPVHSTTITVICYNDVDISLHSNNVCMRGDIHTHIHTHTHTYKQVHITSYGCPGHPLPSSTYPLYTNTSYNTYTADTNNTDKYIPTFQPRYQHYLFTLNHKPVVANTGPVDIPTYKVGYGSTHSETGPVGISTDGVLLYSQYQKYDDNGNEILGFDNIDADVCGGRTDRSYRYQYHAPPLCLLDRMHVSVPLHPSAYLTSTSKDAQVSHWPALGSPSPVVGYALDGFPIYGPYNSTGQLQVSGEGTVLDKCNFDTQAQRYYITANSPYFPPCLVGEPGLFEATVVSHGVCPARGIDNVWCSGPGCVAVQQNTTLVTTPFRDDIKWYVTVAMVVFLMCALLWCEVRRVLYPEVVFYPVQTVIWSILPALLLLLGQKSLLKLFFGLSKAIADYSLNMVPIDVYFQEAVGSFLTVSGTLYSLIISHLLTLTGGKFTDIRNALGNELASCRQAVLCIKAIRVSPVQNHVPGSKTRHDKQVVQKMKAMRVVTWYLSQTCKDWGQPHATEDNSLDVLFGLLPLISTLCDDTNNAFNYHVADRIVDTLNDLSVAKYDRLSLEDQRMPTTLWCLQYLLSTVMFLGVVLIFTGSELLNYTICYLCALLVGVCSLIIADTDMPYSGFISLSPESVYELISTLAANDNIDALGINLDQKNSRFFKSDQGRVSSGTLCKAAEVSSRRNSHKKEALTAVGSERRSSMRGMLRVVSSIRTPKVFSRSSTEEFLNDNTSDAVQAYSALDDDSVISGAGGQPSGKIHGLANISPLASDSDDDFSFDEKVAEPFSALPTPTQKVDFEIAE